MDLKTENSTIDGLEVRTTQLPARAASRLLHRLGKGVLPALGALRGVKIDGGSIPITAITPVIANALDSMTEDEGDELIAKLFASTSVLVDNKWLPLSAEGMIDRAFSGKLMTMYKVAAAAVKVNFGDFLSAALGALAASSKTAVPASDSSSVAT